MNTILRAFVRRKPIEDSGQESQLNRCLGPIDLTALGIIVNSYVIIVS